MARGQLAPDVGEAAACSSEVVATAPATVRPDAADVVLLDPSATTGVPDGPAR